jgi:hypothetical protein
VTPNRRLAIFLAGSAIAAAVVVIALLLPASNPTTGKGQAGKAQKTHTSEQAITVHGTIQKTTAPDGKVAYTLVANATTYRLSDGPEWWWGANDPLASYVGKTVDVTGEVAQGSTDVDVLSIDGKAIRAPGRPPWAGGPKAVGEKHPGFKASRGARDKAKDKGSGKPDASASPSSSASASISPSTLPSASPH